MYYLAVLQGYTSTGHAPTIYSLNFFESKFTILGSDLTNNEKQVAFIIRINNSSLTNTSLTNNGQKAS